MTCIAVAQDDRTGEIVMGCDSMAGTGTSRSIRADRKMFRRGDYLIGYTWSYRMGQVLAHVGGPPPAGVRTIGQMVGAFVPWLQSTLASAGWLKTEAGRDEGGQFIVAVGDTFYVVHSDLSVAWPASNYDAIGCGMDLALGAMHALPSVAPAARVRSALAAAETWSSGVSRPFHTLAQR